jgi:hypothetical protein
MVSNNFNRKGRKSFYFYFEKRKEREAFWPLWSTDKVIKIIALFPINKRVR